MVNPELAELAKRLGVGLVATGQQACQRRFSGPVRSDQADAVAIADDSREVAEYLVRTVVPGEPGKAHDFHDGGTVRSARAVIRPGRTPGTPRSM